MKTKSKMFKLMFERKKRGLTQAQLAEICGMKETTICAYETGRRVPTAITLKKLAIALSCSIDDIV